MHSRLGSTFARLARMEKLIRGKAFKFGDNINSDIIIPGRYLIHIDPEKLAQHAFEVLGDGFPISYDVSRSSWPAGISVAAARGSRP